MAGSNTNPVEYKTPAASGIAIALYPVAQARKFLNHPHLYVVN
jgi:hypothetical protein